MHSAHISPKGPYAILAGAGTGKTHSLVEKIKHLIVEKHYNPKEIVCLTFSNEAADSLQRRIASLIETEELPIVSTIHAFCADLLKNNTAVLGMEEGFRIIEPEETMVLLHTSFKLPANLCKAYTHAIGIAKDMGITYEELKNSLISKSKLYQRI